LGFRLGDGVPRAEAARPGARASTAGSAPRAGQVVPCSGGALEAPPFRAGTAPVTTLQFRVASPREAHDTVVGLYQGVMKPHTRTGAAGVITWQTENEWLRMKMRAAFHGPILKAISEQVWFTDEASGRRFRYSRSVWKEFLKVQFLNPKLEERVDQVTGELKPTLCCTSTEELSDDEYLEFLMEVQSFAILDLGVVFEEDV
jgi:frataxin-like iron-binding protein CyaY